MKTFIGWERIFFILLPVAVLACSPASLPPEQISEQLVTVQDYRRAEKSLAANTSKIVYDVIINEYWQEDERLVYQKSTSQGYNYILVDLTSNGKSPLFEHARLAESLSRYTEKDTKENNLDLTQIEITDDREFVEFNFEESRYRLNLISYALQLLEDEPQNEYLSPDGRKAVYIEAHNLWLRNIVTNELTQLTFDGVESYGYATNNAGWSRGEGPVLLWSPDSKKLATFRHDGRNVKDMYLYSTQVGHPELDVWKYPLPGDEHIFLIERVVLHVEENLRLVRLEMPPDFHRSTTRDHMAGRNGRFLDVEWSADSQKLAFVSSSRDHKSAQLRVANPETGEVRDVFSESVSTYYESGVGSANWRVLHDRNEFIWFSEKSNWGHLYFYDLTNGEFKKQVTSGNWSVLQVQKIDSDKGLIYFTGSNRELGDPYYSYLYRVRFDGSNLVNLTPEPGHHVINWSNSADYFTDTWSTPTQPAESVVRNRDGEVIAKLEETDISALVESGWVAPIPFKVKAREQQTDLYGLMYQPSNLDKTQSYPVLNYLYPGPQTGSVGSRAFQASRRDKQALAELGFVVVEVDAMGTPGRSKSFHDAYYGNMGDNGLPDQITAIRQLAELNSWMDFDRVGIWGHS
ncbi:MAG: S9 family peptidase, partial [Pseudomonadales bacterium]|nr:S9 family peptidase [Pseudomonadales bacterium]